MKSLAVLLVAIVLTVSSSASAEETSPVTLKTTTVHGRLQRPAVAIELSRAKMSLGATTPTLAAGLNTQDASKKEAR
jgi:hypothetical protein